MRKLKLQMQTTVDGYVAGPNGEMDWMQWNWDDELKNYVKDITEPVDCILLGRKLAEGFIPTWASRVASPETADDFGKKMVETHKIVFSYTPQDKVWENTEWVQGDFVSYITQLKHQPGKDIIVYGGSNFVSSLIREDLIDEYHLFVNPVALGNGLTIFKTLKEKQNLHLIKVQAFTCGIALLCYQPERN